MFTVTSEFGTLYGNANKREFIAHIKDTTYLLSKGANDFFGTPRHTLEVVNSLVLVGKDNNWPDPNEAWWARVFESGGYGLDHHIGDRFPTKAEATKTAKAFADKVLTDPANN